MDPLLLSLVPELTPNILYPIICRSSRHSNIFRSMSYFSKGKLQREIFIYLITIILLRRPSTTKEIRQFSVSRIFIDKLIVERKQV